MIGDSIHVADLARDRVPINRIPVAVACYADAMDDDLDTPGGRLRWARSKAGYETGEDFANKVGIKSSTYRSYENGTNGYSRHAAKLAKALGVSADWLLGGGYVPDDSERELSAKRAASLIASDLNVAMVREVDISYAMGDGSVIADYPDTGMMPFDLNFLSMLGARTSESLFLCRGQGDSMAPTIYDSDLVMVDASRNRVTMQDQIWALSVAGAGMIKRIRPLPNGRILVLSDNVLVPEQEYDADDVYVVGKVIWIGRRM